jgi:hypothetical protein
MSSTTSYSEEEEWFINHWNDILTYPTIDDLCWALSEPADVLAAKYRSLRKNVLLLDRPDRKPPPISEDAFIPGEQWVSALGFDSAYEVSDHGRVRSLSRQVKCGPGGKTRQVKGRILKTIITARGYAAVNLSICNTSHQKPLHRLVLESFTGPKSNMVVRHRDGNPLNNKLNNLEWGTHQENMQDVAGHYDEAALTLLDHFEDS